MSILDEAKTAVEEREENYGHPMRNFERIAAFWTTYLEDRLGECIITAADVGPMMNLVKIAREMETHHRDNSVDGAGYWHAHQRVMDALQ